MDPKGSTVSAMDLRRELVFSKYEYMNRRRKRMQASDSNMGKGKGSGGEVRRIHIIYFLSRMGRTEHPHLIRLHHLHRNGVFLRDVKRWLADLRGKEMPEAFAWSYKRRYKSGYVWQDLLDDDLITPISDNEYILKGSEIFPAILFDGCTLTEKEINENKHLEVEAENKQQDQLLSTELNQRYSSDPRIDTPTKTLSEIYQESPTVSSEMSSTLTDDSMKQSEEDPSKHECHEQINRLEDVTSSYYYSKNQLDTKMFRSSNRSTEKMEDTPRSSFSSLSSSSHSPFSKSKRYSSRTSKTLRNLITCGTVDTNDAVLVALHKSSTNKPTQKTDNHNKDNKGGTCKEEIMMGGSTKVFGTDWNQQHQQVQLQSSTRKSTDDRKEPQQQQQQTKCGSSKLVSATYKPMGAPTCSQCGKVFKPERLHAHMKSCRGKKIFLTTASTRSNIDETSHTSSGNKLVAIS